MNGQPSSSTIAHTSAAAAMAPPTGTQPNVESQMSASSALTSDLPSSQAESQTQQPKPRFTDPSNDSTIFVDDGHGWIVFPWSDGDADFGPPNTAVPPPSQDEVNYYHIFEDDGDKDPPKYNWRLKVGKELAEQFGRGVLAPSGAPWKLKSYPANYAMTEQRKGPRSNPRTDAYLFGAKSRRFRSALEFVPHARWLLTDPDRDPSKCLCKYCPGQNKGSRSATHTPAPRKANPAYAPAPTRAGPAVGRGPRSQRPTSDIASVKVRTQPVDPAVRPPGIPVMSCELRDAELPYRKLDPGACEGHRVGEIAWCLLDEPVDDPGSDAKLDRWPVQILSRRGGTQVEPVYEVAMLASGEKARALQSRLVPFMGGAMPKGLSQTLGSIADHPWLLTTDPVPKLHLMDDPETGARAGPRPAYPVIILCLALAVQASAVLRGVCCATDEFSRRSFQVPPPSTVDVTGNAAASSNSDSAPPASIDTNTYWQGLHFGLERIWVGDVVRLRLLETDVQRMANTLAELGKLHGTRQDVPEDGTFVLRVKAIFREGVTAPVTAAATPSASQTVASTSSQVVADSSQAGASPTQPTQAGPGPSDNLTPVNSQAPSQTPAKASAKAKARQSVSSRKVNGIVIAGDVYQVVEEGTPAARAIELRNEEAKQVVTPSPARPQFVSPLRAFLDPDAHGALPPAPSLPRGFVYHKLNHDSVEATVSPANIAGRLWSSLAGPKELAELPRQRQIATRYNAVMETKDPERTKLALAGLLPGIVKAMGVDQRFEDWPTAMLLAESQARDNVLSFMKAREAKLEAKKEEEVDQLQEGGGEASVSAKAPATTATEGADKASTTPSSVPPTPADSLKRKAAEDSMGTPSRPSGGAPSASPLSSSTVQATAAGGAADASNAAKKPRTDDAAVSESLPPLPPGWIEKISRNQGGKPYYIHPQLKRTQWQRPTE